VEYVLKTHGEKLASAVQLEVRLLVAFRDYHSTTHENGALDPHVQAEAASATVTPYPGLPSLHLAHTADELDLTGYRYGHCEYDVERERGLDSTEDLFSPFQLRFDLKRSGRAVLIASTERHDICQAPEYRRAEIGRRQAVLAAAPSDDPLVRT